MLRSSAPAFPGTPNLDDQELLVPSGGATSASPSQLRTEATELGPRVPRGFEASSFMFFVNPDWTMSGREREWDKSQQMPQRENALVRAELAGTAEINTHALMHTKCAHTCKRTDRTKVSESTRYFPSPMRKEPHILHLGPRKETSAWHSRCLIIPEWSRGWVHSFPKFCVHPSDSQNHCDLSPLFLRSSLISHRVHFRGKGHCVSTCHHLLQHDVCPLPVCFLLLLL